MADNSMKSGVSENRPLLKPKGKTAQDARPSSKSPAGADSDKKMEMLRALIKDDLQKVTKLASLANETFGIDKSPAMLIASACCSEKIIKVLYENGATLECCDVRGRAPILVAAASGNVQTLVELLDRGVDAHYVFDEEGQEPPDTPTSVVSDAGKHQGTEEEQREDELMARNKFKLPLPDVSGRTPLHEAALARHSECVKHLLECRALVNFADSIGNTALHLAIDDNDETYDGQSCTRDNKDQCVKFLLDQGADLTAVNKSLLSPLDLLLNQDGASKGVKLLLKYFDTEIDMYEADHRKYPSPNFQLLCPKEGGSQIKVILEMMEKLDRDMRRKLFSHPLLRAFVRLKWSSTRMIFYIYVFVFFLYVMSLSAFVTLAHCDVFYIFGKGWEFKTAENGIPISKAILIATSVMVAVNVIGQAYVLKKSYRWKVEMWRNVAGILTTIIILSYTVESNTSDMEEKSIASASIPIADLHFEMESDDVLETSPTPMSSTTIPQAHDQLKSQMIIGRGYAGDAPNWVINLTALAVFLAWFELMLIIGRFPRWASHALLFQPVMMNVLRILMTYGCLIVGFAFAFFILFRKTDADGFGDPWRALIKTVVMMTGEYEYKDMFHNQEDSNEIKGQWIRSDLSTISRLTFLVFVITASIALMNLMLALAVSDTQDLIRISKESQIMKLARAVVHWGYFIEIWSENRYLPVIVRTFLREQFSMKIKKGHYYQKMNEFPEELKKRLKEIAMRQSVTSPERREKIETLFNAIMDLVEGDEDGLRDTTTLQTKFGTITRKKNSKPQVDSTQNT